MQTFGRQCGFLAACSILAAMQHFGGVPAGRQCAAVMAEDHFSDSLQIDDMDDSGSRTQGSPVLLQPDEAVLCDGIQLNGEIPQEEEWEGLEPEHMPSRQSLRKSFANAWRGIVVCMTEERNIKIHCFAAVMVIIFGFILEISVTEWLICFVLFGLIMGLELVNTAMENVVDLVTDEWKELAGKAKDCAAGAVLIAAIWTAAAGGTIFFPKLFRFIMRLLGSG